MWAWVEALKRALGLAEKTAEIVHHNQVESGGIAKQAAADLGANVKASQDASIIRDQNAARTRDELVDRLHEQTGVAP